MTANDKRPVGGDGCVPQESKVVRTTGGSGRGDRAGRRGRVRRTCSDNKRHSGTVKKTLSKQNACWTGLRQRGLWAASTYAKINYSVRTEYRFIPVVSSSPGQKRSGEDEGRFPGPCRASQRTTLRIDSGGIPGEFWGCACSAPAKPSQAPWEQWSSSSMFTRVSYGKKLASMLPA